MNYVHAERRPNAIYNLRDTLHVTNGPLHWSCKQPIQISMAKRDINLLYTRRTRGLTVSSLLCKKLRRLVVVYVWHLQCNCRWVQANVFDRLMSKVYRTDVRTGMDMICQFPPIYSYKVLTEINYELEVMLYSRVNSTSKRRLLSLQNKVIICKNVLFYIQMNHGR